MSFRLAKAVLLQLCMLFFCAAVSIPSIQQIDLESLSARLNDSLALNQTALSSTNLSHNARPRDPFIINPRHSTRIEVSTYGRPLAELDVLQCILPATEQQVAEIESSYPQDPPIGDNLRFRSDNVTLTLLPTLRMRWSIWGVTLRGLTKFFYQNEYMELTFLVKENGFMVGIGRFKLQPRTATG